MTSLRVVQPRDLQRQFLTSSHPSGFAFALRVRAWLRSSVTDEYITKFAKLARKVLYYEDNPMVLEKFKSGLLLELLEPCMHHDDPQNWEAWTRSARAHQPILTSLKTHQTDTTQ